MSAKIEELFRISGQVVAVTGAAGVIYGTLSRTLAANGAKVALLDIAGEKVSEQAEEIRKAGGSAIGVPCDVLDPASVQAALDSILSEFGRCDVLINGAGGNRKGACVPPDGTFSDVSIDEMEKAFALNYKGTVLPSQVFCQYFEKQGRGSIINTSSMSALRPLTNVPAYSNAKAAVTNFTQWLAVQVRVDHPDADIRVNEIAPGFLHTTQNHFLLYEKDGTTLTGRGRSILSHTPMGRFGKPEELVGAVLLLMSPAGSFIHGTTLVVDGGFNACSGVGPLDEKRPS